MEPGYILRPSKTGSTVNDFVEHFRPSVFGSWKSERVKECNRVILNEIEDLRQEIWSQVSANRIVIIEDEAARCNSTYFFRTPNSTASKIVVSAIFGRGMHSAICRVVAALADEKKFYITSTLDVVQNLSRPLLRLFYLEETLKLARDIISKLALAYHRPKAFHKKAVAERRFFILHETHPPAVTTHLVGLFKGAFQTA